MLTFKDYLIEKCNCWTGYKRKPGTKPCAEGSCVKEETQLDEGLDPSEVAGNPKMYSAEVVKKAYYHKKASESDKKSLANHLDRYHGPKEWRKPVKESLADQILATAKAAGINAKIAPPLADRKKATMKLLKHRAREAKRNPPPPREMPPRKTGFGSGAEDDTKGT